MSMKGNAKGMDISLCPPNTRRPQQLREPTLLVLLLHPSLFTSADPWTSSNHHNGYQYPVHQLLQEMGLFGNLLLLMHIFNCFVLRSRVPGVQLNGVAGQFLPWHREAPALGPFSPYPHFD